MYFAYEWGCAIKVFLKSIVVLFAATCVASAGQLTSNKHSAKMVLHFDQSTHTINSVDGSTGGIPTAGVVFRQSVHEGNSAYFGDLAGGDVIQSANQEGLPSGNGVRTYIFTMKSTQTMSAGGNYFLSHGEISTNKWVAFYIDSGRFIHSRDNSDDTKWDLQIDSGILNTFAWVYYGTGVERLYKYDGKLLTHQEKTGLTTRNTVLTGTFEIGGRSGISGCGCSLDEVGIYGEALNRGQIQSIIDDLYGLSGVSE